MFDGIRVTTMLLSVQVIDYEDPTRSVLKLMFSVLTMRINAGDEVAMTVVK